MRQGYYFLGFFFLLCCSSFGVKAQEERLALRYSGGALKKTRYFYEGDQLAFTTKGDEVMSRATLTRLLPEDSLVYLDKQPYRLSDLDCFYTFKPGMNKTIQSAMGLGALFVGYGLFQDNLWYETVGASAMGLGLILMTQKRRRHCIRYPYQLTIVVH